MIHHGSTPLTMTEISGCDKRIFKQALNIVYAVQDRYDFSGEMKNPEQWVQFPNLMSRYRNIVSAVDKFTLLL
jgi:hypothetical protein